uniref:Uncharacterized protein n=1 Tax=Caenorhabditis japonica TaxID=281687 RepID=A0A8R1EMK3_CAEJA
MTSQQDDAPPTGYNMGHRHSLTIETNPLHLLPSNMRRFSQINSYVFTQNPVLEGYQWLPQIQPPMPPLQPVFPPVELPVPLENDHDMNETVAELESGVETDLLNDLDNETWIPFTAGQGSVEVTKVTQEATPMQSPPKNRTSDGTDPNSTGTSQLFFALALPVLLRRILL